MKGKHVLITGASGGVGIITALEFLKIGANVTLQYNSNSTSLQPLKEKYQSRVCLLKADVTDESQVAGLVSKAVQQLGNIESLIVCHGIWPSKDVLVKDMDYKQWRNTLAINLDGAFLFIKHFLRQITMDMDAPSIVLIGSTAGKFGEAYHADYSCSKTAMMYGLISSLKNEVVKIHPRARINTVSPGWIRTPMAERAMKDPSLLYQALASSPLKKVSEPNDIAQAILFLADSTKSGNITGVSLDVNAGMEGRLLNQPSDFGIKSKL
ncbi:hypothetical protein HK103_002078 [Boothiomyces macroporosus]|uniref:Uncharacterized protein n=1 Tax=Boothiomyces macroporosus TaxID=261099 RepID=A0AAD5UDJ5_9FUNG|nr:hypothetical protein HK103_002078 [Boothiomyces macroporosus]